MSEAVAWDEGFDACRDGVKRRNPYQPLPGAAAVPEAQDGREALAEALWTAVDNAGIKGRLFREDCDFLASIALASTAVREGERERLAAAIERAMRIPTHAPGDGSKYDLGREFGYNLAHRLFRAALAPSLAAPEGTEQ